MICDTCGKKIKNELYLRRDRKNFKHRGNETDEVYECKTGKKFSKMWESYEKEVESEEKEFTKIKNTLNYETIL